MKRGAIISLLFISVFLLSGIAGCGRTSSSSGTSNDASPSASNDHAQRFSSRNGVYHGSITFTADEVTGYPRATNAGATGATEHLSTTINFSDYHVGADEWSQSWEVPVSGTYDYSCATTGTYIPPWESTFPWSASFSGVFSTAPTPTLGGSKGIENGVTLSFSSSNVGAIVPTGCEAANGVTGLTKNVIYDIFSITYGNTDKLASEWYPTYYFKDGETVSFGRTFRMDPYNGAGEGYTNTITYSGTVTVVRDK